MSSGVAHEAVSASDPRSPDPSCRVGQQSGPQQTIGRAGIPGLLTLTRGAYARLMSVRYASANAPVSGARTRAESKNESPRCGSQRENLSMAHEERSLHGLP